MDHKLGAIIADDCDDLEHRGVTRWAQVKLRVVVLLIGRHRVRRRMHDVLVGHAMRTGRRVDVHDNNVIRIADGYRSLDNQWTVVDPVCTVEVVTPEEFPGEVMGDLARRRGIPERQERRDDGFAITATVPLSEMSSYAR